jgi:hypothetical protein
MYFLVAGHHRDHIANSGFFQHIEYDLVLANVDLEFNIVVIFNPALVHYILYILTYTN